jgi:hypothetical protein
MASLEVSQTGNRLDAHHLPETNGRMAICRRCGARTDSAGSKHVPDEQRLVRSDEWLETQAHTSRIDRAKAGFNK